MAQAAQSTVVTFVDHQAFPMTTQFGPGTKHKLTTDNDAVYETWKDAVASSAVALIGRPAQIEYTVRKNGDYTNYTLTTVAPFDQKETSGAPAAPAQPPVQLTEKERKKELRIMRQSASKVAIDLLRDDERTFENLVVLAERLIRYFAGGPDAALPPSASSSPPAEAPAGAADVAPARPAPSSDIPF